MNYILNQLQRKIDFLKSDGQKQELKVHYQAKFEFMIVYFLAYLWNKNWQKIDVGEREYVINCILKPSIGTIVSIIRKIDTENEIFGNRKVKKLHQALDSYPQFRNERIGHGYSFEDDIESHLVFFESIFDIIEGNDLIINKSVDLIKVTKEDNSSYKGVAYKSDGITYLSWSCPKQTAQFNVGELYLLTDEHEYVRISPFIKLNNETDFFTFCSIDEKLTGRTKYNQLLKTGTITEEVLEFEKLTITSDKIKRKTANGTVINIFENNYKKYIDIGIAGKILTFLDSNKSSVFATIWGHGGVGKTASIQRICEILSNQEKKIFDYVIFVSAKDRYYNYYQGRVHLVSNSISSLDDIVSTINTVVYNDSSFIIDPIISYSGKLLIIIDDFETFSKEEKNRITTFVKRLDINHHKVVLTTRAATLITGEEIQTKELSEEETIIFFKEAIKIEVPDFDIKFIQKELLQNEIKKKIFKITSGRPLFILQLAIYVAQKGNLSDAIKTEIHATKEAINFLYDRLYEYLSVDARNMFIAISLLVSENDLTGFVDTLKFILNKEDKDEEFSNAINELIKLKIITIQEKDFFKVYSPEIFKLMQLYYQNKGDEYDGNITNRFNLINTDKGSNTEIALLENANASRIICSEQEVENKYRYILNRDKAPLNIKLDALLNFASYLTTHKGKIEKALKLFHDYYHIFRKHQDFIKAYATYSWALGTFESKISATKIIQDYFATKPKLDTHTYLEFLGLLMTYEGISIVAERDELKLKIRYNEITKSQAKVIHDTQKDRIGEIYKYPGLRLYNMVKDVNLETLKGSCRAYVLDGLTHFIEICIRNSKRSVGKIVCNKVISELPPNYQKPFQYKLTKIDFIENPDKYDNDSSKIDEKLALSDLGIKLQQALKK